MTAVHVDWAMTPGWTAVATVPGYRAVCSVCGTLPGVRRLRSGAWQLLLAHDRLEHP